jgi:hypothetical protein
MVLVVMVVLMLMLLHGLQCCCCSQLHRWCCCHMLEQPWPLATGQWAIGGPYCRCCLLLGGQVLKQLLPLRHHQQLLQQRLLAAAGRRRHGTGGCACRRPCARSNLLLPRPSLLHRLRLLLHRWRPPSLLLLLSPWPFLALPTLLLPPLLQLLLL